MKTIKFLTYSVFVLLLSISISSCKGDDGAVGPAGADGIDGTNGTNGSDGADGNANVTIITLDNTDVTWVAGSYLGRNSNTFTLTDNSVSQDIIDHGIVLGYVELSSQWYTLPLIWSGSEYQHILNTYALNTINLYAYRDSGNGLLAPGITTWKFLLITDNTVAGRNVNIDSKQLIKNELENAGVNINDYYAVCDYYGIDTE